MQRLTQYSLLIDKVLLHVTLFYYELLFDKFFI